MADIKISALPAATTLAGTETLPVVQAGVTVQATVTQTLALAALKGLITASGLTQSTNKLLGRNTAAAGAVEEITLGTNLSMTGTTLNSAGGSGLPTDGSGTMTGAISTTVGTMTSTVANGATAKGFTLNTPSYTTTGAKLLSVANNAVEKVFFDKDGGIAFGGGTNVLVPASRMYIDTNYPAYQGYNGARLGGSQDGFYLSVSTGVFRGTNISGSGQPTALWLSDTCGIRETSAGSGVLAVDGATVNTFRDIKVRTYLADSTITASGTTGAQTINKSLGTVNFAAAATSLVVTNSLVTTSSFVFCTIRTNDSTAIIKNVVPAAGSFTIALNAAATAETSVGFIVYN